MNESSKIQKIWKTIKGKAKKVKSFAVKVPRNEGVPRGIVASIFIVLTLGGFVLLFLYIATSFMLSTFPYPYECNYLLNSDAE